MCALTFNSRSTPSPEKLIEAWVYLHLNLDSGEEGQEKGTYFSGGKVVIAFPSIKHSYWVHDVYIGCIGEGGKHDFYSHVSASSMPQEVGKSQGSPMQLLKSYHEAWLKATMEKIHSE